jgi:hypothetical protein
MKVYLQYSIYCKYTEYSPLQYVQQCICKCNGLQYVNVSGMVNKIKELTQYSFLLPVYK